MNDAVLSALADEGVQQCYLGTTVTRSCLIVRSPSAPAHIIIALHRVSGISTTMATYPGLLVIATGFFVIAAAAFSSKQGDGAGTPIGVLGVVFCVVYWVTRKAALAFSVGSERTETAFGTVSEAATLRKAVRQARAREENAGKELSDDKYVVLKRSLSQAVRLRWLGTAR